MAEIKNIANDPKRKEAALALLEGESLEIGSSGLTPIDIVGRELLDLDPAYRNRGNFYLNYLDL